MRKKRYSLTHLLCYRAVTVAIGRVERLVIAERTTSPPYFSVTVRAGKAGINGNFLHFAAEYTTQIIAELVI
jgi:hypothetical protein